MDNIKIRTANIHDSADILSIYAPYIDTQITFEYTVPGLDEFTSRVKSILEVYPFLVAEIDNKIVGYAYAHRHKERAAYNWNAELSVYIQKEYTKYGMGKVFVKALLNILSLQGVRNVYGCVTLPNPASEKLHEYFGFNYLGTLKETGYKGGKWHSTKLFEKSIRDHDIEPEPIKSIKEIDTKIIDKIIEESKKFLK